MSVEIVPAILPKTFLELHQKLKAVKDFVSTAQVDICDGTFVKSKTWPYSDSSHFGEIVREEEGFPYGQELDIEFDLMIAKPENAVADWVSAGAKRIIIHAESTDVLEHLIDDFLLRYANRTDDVSRVELGLALSVETPLSLIEPFMDRVDVVQCMGIARIGFQGEPFDERVIDKVRALRERYPDHIISVDGGVNAESAPKLVRAGASRLMVGTALFSSGNMREAIAQFQNL